MATIRFRAIAICFTVMAAPAGVFAQTDWDLYAMRLINRARANPAAEAAIIGSSVVDNRAPVPPLALHRLVCQAATNHVHWMHDNLGSIDSDVVPDSWSLYECLDGNHATIPAVGTPSFTGVGVWNRLAAVGFQWEALAETGNAITSEDDILIDRLRIEAEHRGYWEHNSVRSFLLRSTHTVYGQHMETRTFQPPRGGVQPPLDNLFFSDVIFSSPLAPSPRHYLLGLVYEDRDGSGDWTPRDDGDASREGLAGISCTVYTAGTTTVVTTGTTMDNGAFAINVNSGTYDLVFTLPEHSLRIDGMVVTANVEVGDVEVVKQGELFEACIAGPGAAPEPQRLGYTAQLCLDAFDVDEDLDIDLEDFAAHARSAVAQPLAGDMDGDGDVDRDDLTAFTDCLAGPVDSAPIGCGPADMNQDGSIDLGDFGTWQRLFATAR